MEGCGAKLRQSKRADNITFGVDYELPGLPAWRTQMFQAEGYFFTFGKRLLRPSSSSGWAM